MSTFIYKPTQENISGEIVLRMPLYEERIEFLDELNILDKENKVDEEKKKSFKTFGKMLKIARNFYESVDITRLKADGSTVNHKTYEDISSDPACADIIREIATSMINGGLGND